MNNRRFLPLTPVLVTLLLLAATIPRAATAAGSTVSVPEQLILQVRETASVARQGEIVRSGVPIPRSLGLKSTAGLAVLDGTGTAVPAEFRVTARWNAGKNDTTAPIQWLLVSFPATVGASGTSTYRVVTDGSIANPAPARPVLVQRSGNSVTVDTGAAVFRLGTDPGALFDEIALADGTRVASGGRLSLRNQGQEWGHSTTRRVKIEHTGPLSAVVVVEGAYDTPAIGNGALSSRRRYVFTAGSPTAVVRHVVNWEGNLACPGCLKTSSGAPNGVLLDTVQDAITLDLGGTPEVTAIGALGAPAVTGSVGSSASAWVRQQLRTSRTAPLAFDIRVAGSSASGARADGALLAASGPRGTVAIALNHMHRYEPQALRLLPGGALAVNVADDKAWLANHQGLFATMSVTAVSGRPSREGLERLAWAPLNRPLRAWAQPEWFAASQAVDEFPTGTLPTELAAYDGLVSGVLQKTAQKIDSVGLPGLMTFGVYPRYWGVDWDGEVDCGSSGDPTPNDTWDNLFWCGGWTDYHMTASAAQVWAMRTGQVEWLDEIAVPAALRTLHTQIMQCGPEKWFYCGQAPTGYGAYRSDFNSSHAYFDNLFLYYWMTGDETVLDIVRRGGDSMRRWLCDTRGPGPVVEPTGPGGPACAADRPVNINASLTGRVGSQWLSAFRFLGHASDDPSFLEDFHSGLARAVTQQYAHLNRDGVTYGLWGGPSRVTTAGAYTTDPAWTIAFYDMNNLWRLQRDTGDAAIGIPALRPSAVIGAVARTLRDIQPTVSGDGTPGGSWARLLDYTFTGDRVGGTLTSVGPKDRELYSNEKGGMSSVLLRAGQTQNDPALVEAGREMALFTMGVTTRDAAPLGKLSGQNLTRLHASVARLAGAGDSLPPPPPPPSATAPAAPSALTAQAASDTAISLAWQDNSSDEAAFYVERLDGGSYQQILTVGANATTARIDGLAPGTGYTFRVRAGNSAGFSAYSNTASATTSSAPTEPPPAATVPVAPVRLRAQAISGSVIDLVWRDRSNDETAFHVEQEIGGRFVEVLTVAADTRNVRVGGLQPNTTYRFRVRASNAAGYSAYSNTAQAKTASGAAQTGLAAPTNLRITHLGQGTVRLDWRDNSTTEMQFIVQRMVNGVYERQVIVGPNSTTALVSGLKTFASYTFRVKVIDAQGNTAFSRPANVNTF